MENTNTDTAQWFRVFDGTTLTYICDVKANLADIYDPRIGGDGNVVWQAI